LSTIKPVLAQLDKDRSNLVRALQLIQEKEGYLSNQNIQRIAEYFSIPPVEVEGVLSFYTQFRRSKPGKYVISICDGTACHIKGSKLISTWIADELNIHQGETDSQGLFTLKTVACLGCCSLAPVISVNGKIYGNLNRKKLMKVLKAYQQPARSGSSDSND
jgi:NADH-quinone oxidoreductase subunit E